MSKILIGMWKQARVENASDDDDDDDSETD